MTIEMIETFLLLGEYKNFTKTARKLFVAQSTVTNRIAELEKEIGQTLVKRTNKSVELTIQGKIYYDFASRMIQLQNSALSLINEDEGNYKRKVRIGTTNTIYECHLKSKLLSFLSDQDNRTMVKITIGHSAELLDMLTMDLIDIVYIYLPFQKAGFTCDCFCVDELVLVCDYQDSTYAHGIRKEELVQLQYIYCNFALQEVGLFIRELFPRHYPFFLEIDNSTKALDYILAGIGYSFLPQSLVSHFLAENRLRSLPLLDFESPKINNYRIHRNSSYVPNL